MPQLVPYIFIHEILTGFTLILTLIFLLSNYFLPAILRLLLTRFFITQL